MITFPEQRIDQLITDVMKTEGWDAYTNDPDDAGKETKWGVTIASARAYGYTGAMKDMPETVARAIYRKRYVDEPRFADVFAIEPTVGAELIDTGVNVPATLAQWLQRYRQPLRRSARGRSYRPCHARRATRVRALAWTARYHRADAWPQ
jgi:lysozyme family protein